MSLLWLPVYRAQADWCHSCALCVLVAILTVCVHTLRRLCCWMTSFSLMDLQEHM
jgi:hypothetical protein